MFQKKKNMIDNIVFINVDDIKDAKDKYEHIHADHDAYKTIYQLKTKRQSFGYQIKFVA